MVRIKFCRGTQAKSDLGCVFEINTSADAVQSWMKILRSAHKDAKQRNDLKVAGASLRRHFAIETLVLLAMLSQGRDGPPHHPLSSQWLGPLFQKHTLRSFLGLFP